MSKTPVPEHLRELLLLSGKLATACAHLLRSDVRALSAAAAALDKALREYDEEAFRLTYAFAYPGVAPEETTTPTLGERDA